MGRKEGGKKCRRKMEVVLDGQEGKMGGGSGGGQCNCFFFRVRAGLGGKGRGRPIFSPSLSH